MNSHTTKYKIILGFILFNAFQMAFLFITGLSAKIPSLLDLSVNLGILTAIISLIAFIPNIVVSIIALADRFCKKTIPWRVVTAEMVSSLLLLFASVFYLARF